MKKHNLVLIPLYFFLILSSCCTDKNEIPLKYKLNDAENNIEWTAYKTSSKTPVIGKFSKIKITSQGEGNTLKEAIENVTFSIPISSLVSSGGKYNIINYFFKVMDNTSLLSGKIKLTDETTGFVEFTMNGITDQLHFTYSIEGEKFKLTAIMDLRKWNVEKAIASLNNQCELVHRGSDGIVKLWDDVSITVTSTFN